MLTSAHLASTAYLHNTASISGDNWQNSLNRCLIIQQQLFQFDNQKRYKINNIEQKRETRHDVLGKNVLPGYVRKIYKTIISNNIKSNTSIINESL